MVKSDWHNPSKLIKFEPEVTMTSLHPKKLLMTKWTAVKPVAKQKHFLVTKVIEPETEIEPVEWIEIEAVYSKKARRIQWQELQDESVWLQGWV